jgi:hypothetical protein
MNRNEQIAAIRAACIAANPEIETKRPTACPFESSSEHGEYCKGVSHTETVTRTIRLVDVLSAIEYNSRHVSLLVLADKLHMGKYGDGRATEGYYSHVHWNLRTDDLEQQSDETVAFLVSLLAPRAGGGD